MEIILTKPNQKAALAIVKAMIQDTPNARLAAWDYTAKGTGERAIHTLQLNVSYENDIKNDLIAMRQVVDSFLKNGIQGVKLEAAQRIVTSLNDTATNGAGNNQDYTLRGKRQYLGNGISYDASGNFFLTGKQVKKVVKEKGVYKTVNSRPLTLARKELEKDLNKSKWRTFKIDSDYANRFASNKNLLVFSREIDLIDTLYQRREAQEANQYS